MNATRSLYACLLAVPLLGGFAFHTLASASLAQEEQAPGWTQEQLEEVTREIQGEVEDLRGQAYKRPVDVKVTNREGFIEHAKQRMDQLTTPAELAAEEDIAKLLGLIPPTMDLWGVTFSVLEDQVGGFYDPGSDTFFLMDSFTGAVAKIILAHELTHALDDQLYDIDGTLAKVMANRDAAAAYQAVVEGSGTAMMTKWMLKFGGQLTPAEASQAASMGTESLGVAPTYVWKPLLAAYTTGNTFLDRGYRIQKKQGRSFSDVTRMAFEAPPRSTEQVLHPKKYWDAEERDEPKAVTIQADLPEGWEVLDRTSLGELVLALMTDDSGPVDFTNPLAVAFLKYTNAAAEGWGGDQAILCGKGEARLLHVATTWDTAEDAVEFRAALEARLAAWREDVGALGGGVELSSVDPEQSLSVRFSAWSGVDAGAARAVAGTLSVR
jgi:PAS domain-containing protein